MHICALQQIGHILLLIKKNSIFHIPDFNTEKIAKLAKIFDREVTPKLLEQIISSTCS
jgi:hypothetical protein